MTSRSKPFGSFLPISAKAFPVQFHVHPLYLDKMLANSPFLSAMLLDFHFLHINENVRVSRCNRVITELNISKSATFLIFCFE